MKKQKLSLCLEADDGSSHRHRTVDLPGAARDGDFERVHGLDAAGLASDDSATLLFLRGEVTDMWNFLDTPSKMYLVQGPPGTGKSSATWAWACRKAADGGDGVSVLWVHLHRSGGATVAMVNGTTVTLIGKVKTLDVVGIVERFSGSVIILDGVVTTTNEELRDASAVWVERAGRRLVVVTSESLTIPGEELTSTGTIEHKVMSWSLEQYAAAVQCAAFADEVQGRLGDGVDIHEQLADKFFLAGGSARWMFGMDVVAATTDIDKHLERVPDKQTLLSGLQGAKAAGSVNHLVQRVVRGTFLVSEYVARCLAETCEIAFVVAARAQAQVNPSFDGWVFEMDFMARLRLAHDQQGTLKVSINSTDEDWDVAKLIRFQTPADLVGDRVAAPGPEVFTNQLAVGTNSWLIPKRWNQGGYDAAQVLEKSLRFVQVTRAGTHSLKLQYMLALARELVRIGRVVETVDVVFVVPVEGKDDFTPPGSAGLQLSEWGWTLEDVRVAGFERSHA